MRLLIKVMLNMLQIVRAHGRPTAWPEGSHEALGFSGLHDPILFPQRLRLVRAAKRVERGVDRGLVMSTITKRDRLASNCTV